MDIGLSFAKYVLFLFNLLFALLGIALVMIGIGVRINLVEYQDFIEDVLTSHPIFLIVVGCVMFFIAYMGCCGAIKEQTGMLCCYSFMMIILVGLEVGLICAAYSKRDQLKGIVDERLNYTLHHADKDQSYFASWNMLQTKLKCCGINGPNDWNHVLPNDNLPGSCCQRAADDKTCRITEAIQTGCKSAFMGFLNSHTFTLVCYAIGAVLIQLLAIIFPCCLFSAVRRDERLPRRWNRH
ncbi:23 kDa integral membrane protein-like [Sitodiplosis mosellana]|uniref:23 kDa integral membrane protein-like n=1 Tax=Sitodiplosis mosellana TaxID=263140 RepID=UPI0024451B13|nr:23 kDa integral membrane protein-like [Sitodiplosis mosellana]